MYQMSSAMALQFTQAAIEMVEEIRKIGRNPLKNREIKSSVGKIIIGG